MESTEALRKRYLLDEDLPGEEIRGRRRRFGV